MSLHYSLLILKLGKIFLYATLMPYFYYFNMFIRGSYTALYMLINTCNSSKPLYFIFLFLNELFEPRKHI